MTKFVRRYLMLLAGLTAISCIAQLSVPLELGTASAWGVAPGWQREIAFWNLAMYILVVRTLRSGDAASGRTLAIALLVLQFLAASNHAAAAIHGRALLNAVMCVANYGCVVLGGVALWRDRVAALAGGGVGHVDSRKGPSAKP